MTSSCQGVAHSAVQVAVLPDYEVPCQLMMKQVEGAMSFHLGVFALQGLNGVCKQHSYA